MKKRITQTGNIVLNAVRRLAGSSVSSIIFRQSLLMAAVLLATSCRTAPPVAKHTALGWRPIVSWSGTGNTQTDSFGIGSGQWRIKWETSNEKAPGKGNLKITVHSLVSGRFVVTPVNFKGVGHDIAYIAEEPRQFFLVIESHDIDWNISVEEGVIGEQQDAR